MPLFFFVAGLFASKWAVQSWRTLLSGKLAYFIWPFLLWQLAVLVYKVIAALAMPSRAETLELLIPLTIVSPLRPGGETWFLWALTLYFILGKLLASRSTIVVLMGSGAVALAWGQVVQPLMTDSAIAIAGPGLYNVPAYAVLFFAGLRLRDWAFKRVEAFSTKSAVLVVSFAAIVIGFVEAFGLYRVELILAAIAVAGGCALAKLLSSVRTLGWVGRHTLPIYLTHTPIIVGVYSILATTNAVPSGSLADLLVFSTAAVALVLGSLLAKQAGQTWLFVPPNRLLALLLSKVQAPSH
ncbi:hypothetical protein BJH93_09635 [Kocuria polaris]|nr:hypothetical protein [Kocuria polaris]